MKTQGKFILYDIEEFKNYIFKLNISGFRTINHVQNHHTFSPSYQNFNGVNHFEKLLGMEDYHVNQRKFKEIAQNLTTFPDGTIALCRNLNTIPAGIALHNTGGICIEHLGNFNTGQDRMSAVHKETIVKLNALLCLKFNLPITIHSIVYHHWFRLSDGVRDHGENDPALKDHKTCPGTVFFGGNKVADAQKNFLPLVSQAFHTYKAQMANPVSSYKVGSVKAQLLNVRNGPGINFSKTGSLPFGHKVTIFETQGGWNRIGDQKWVSSEYILMDS